MSDGLAREAEPTQGAEHVRDLTARFRLNTLRSLRSGRAECSIHLTLEGRVLAATDMRAHNTFEDTDVVSPQAFNGARLSGNTLSIELPAMSVVVLTLR